LVPAIDYHEPARLCSLTDITSDSARVPKMLMFSSRLMPPINTRCKLGEFAPSVNHPRCYLTPTKLIKSDSDPVRIPLSAYAH
jgi:hypothetical protein